MAFITPRRKRVARIAWRRHDRHPVPSMICTRPAQVLPPAGRQGCHRRSPPWAAGRWYV